MKKQLPEQTRFFLYLTPDQAMQVARLREAGVSASTIARQSVRKCHTVELLPELDAPRPERFNVYLSHEDNALLVSVSKREDCSRAQALRRLVSTYLTINETAINALF